MRTNRTKNRPRPARDVDSWCAEFAARCRAGGVRLTPQRLAVYRAVAADDTHPTAETVYARVRAEVPTLSPATVYRILETFERRRLVRRVSTTSGVARFDANLAPHQHLVCRVCGRMLDHFTPVLAGARIAPDAIPGFFVEELDVRLVGRCLDCAKGPELAAPGRVRSRSQEPPSRRRN